MRSTLTVAAFAFVLCASSNAQITNQDDCVNSGMDVLVGPGSYAFDTSLATTGLEGQLEDNCNAFGTTDVETDIWFTYTATATGIANFSTCGATGTHTDTRIAIYPDTMACPMNGDSLACVDDGCAGGGFLTNLNIEVTAGTNYIVQLGSFMGVPGGTGTLDITEGPPEPSNCASDGSFEFAALTSNFGWNSTDALAPFSAAGIDPAGFSTGFGFFTTAPTDGTLSYTNGFDAASGPDTIRLDQDIAVTAGQLPLTFDWRAAWDMGPFGATLDRTFDVVIRDSGGAVLQTTNILTAVAGTTNVDTGSMTSSVPLSPMFDGQTVNVAFEWFIPETNTGPGLFELDNVRCGLVAGTFPEGCNGDGGDGMGCTDCPCGNNSMPGTVGGCVNSAGTSSRLLASGVATATGSNMTPPLRFECSGVAPANSAQLTSGNAAAPANAANPCFGLNSGITSVSLDGLRCAVQSVLRHGVRPSDLNGDVGVTTNGWGGSNNFFNYNAFTVGQTKFFQVIHRDNAAAVCLTGQNTTQYVEATFTP